MAVVIVSCSAAQLPLVKVGEELSDQQQQLWWLRSPFNLLIVLLPFAKPTEEQSIQFFKDRCMAATESRGQKSLYRVLDGLSGFSCVEKTLHCDC